MDITVMQAIKIAKALLGKIDTKVSRKMPLETPLKRDDKGNGSLGQFGLTDWWLSTFTDEERDYIEGRFDSGGPISLTKGSMPHQPDLEDVAAYVPPSAGELLLTLSSWFKGPEDRHIAKRILAKGEEVSASKALMAYEECMNKNVPAEEIRANKTWRNSVIDLHLVYSEMVEVYYRERDTTPTGLADAISVCEKQIALCDDAAQAWQYHLDQYPDTPLPAHSGYTQLCIIREKEHEYEEAIRLATQAMEQGWMGDWEKRIARNQKRLDRLK